ncbi:MAG: hypothetical protein ABS87_02555 [Sphingomonas sp. SCN 67-18]|uniref:hypothetical protein n=1 Tax=uncultured Sphingomonas sp. TaxID=158754 RepID=UPI00086D01CC|nr:hypothetical protein [Sphingomonas sp. SCN 67-18]ODU22251.1 MAG: hypothetical protein ABS87_02555 [Sphingomonas sp. SCN 67-18]
MAGVDGEWDCITKSPLGEQKSVLTVKTDGSSWTGSNAGPLGSLDVIDGKVDGNTLTWKMDMKVPMPLTLDCTATIDGDTLTGGITAGAFGTSPMTGTRRS